MSSWPFMACDEMRKRHLNDRINATILKSIKKYAEIKHFACYLYLKICQSTGLSSDNYENIMDGFKMQNNELWRHYWRFIEVLFIRIAEHVHILNKIQVEENVSVFNTIFER